jgi:hypothetical protein
VADAVGADAGVASPLVGGEDGAEGAVAVVMRVVVEDGGVGVAAAICLAGRGEGDGGSRGVGLVVLGKNGEVEVDGVMGGELLLDEGEAAGAGVISEAPELGLGCGEAMSGAEVGEGLGDGIVDGIVGESETFCCRAVGHLLEGGDAVGEGDRGVLLEVGAAIGAGGDGVVGEAGRIEAVMVRVPTSRAWGGIPVVGIGEELGEGPGLAGADGALVVGGGVEEGEVDAGGGRELGDAGLDGLLDFGYGEGRLVVGGIVAGVEGVDGGGAGADPEDESSENEAGDRQVVMPVGGGVLHGLSCACWSVRSRLILMSRRSAAFLAWRMRSLASMMVS